MKKVLWVKEGRHQRDAAGQAKSATVFILREEMPWSLGQIASYLGLKGADSVLYHVRRIRGDAKLLKGIQIIRDSVPGQI